MVNTKPTGKKKPVLTESEALARLAELQGEASDIKTLLGDRFTDKRLFAAELILYTYTVLCNRIAALQGNERCVGRTKVRAQLTKYIPEKSLVAAAEKIIDSAFLLASPIEREISSKTNFELKK